MFWITDSLRAKTSDFQPQRRRLGQALRLFWQFSCFYGEYQSRPIAERRRYVQEHERQRIKQPILE